MNAHAFYTRLVLTETKKLSVEKVKALESVLRKVFALFCCSNIVDDNWGTVISRKQFNLVNSVIPTLMEKLRPDAVALVDSFDIIDALLMSTIGRYDGNVYEALLD